MSSRAGLGKDSNRVLVFHDKISNSVPVIDQDHRRTHLGVSYTWSHFYSAVAAGASVLTLIAGPIVSPATRMHVAFRVAGTAAFRYRLTFNPTITDFGTSEFGRLYNRESAAGESPRFLFFFGATASADGTQLQDRIAPAGYEMRSGEWIFQHSDVSGGQAIRLTNLGSAAADVSIEATFYEDDPVEAGAE